MPMTASKLRQDIYRVLDQVLETGIPVEIERKGRKLRIAVLEPVSKFDRLVKREEIVGNPQDLVHIDWSTEWKP